MSKEVTPAQHLAAIAGLALTSNRAMPKGDLMQFIQGTKEVFIMIGGIAALLADDLGVKSEFERHVDEGQARVAAFIASQGLEGSA
ncbi:hypothetical protein [Paracoccus denitrificans]|jgi:hypothetical protein|uniref:Uncharacterized protein n=1 Tax=Paracoccus denitrificans (strain Pd 1222) TaxID=318586 RepID=A1B8J8_PARDP|nr:hypothetical protein [Paracoccus denitrificans]ABL71842.1 hypothetical protein Pden_3776 [Paracoccus denitrificans PD1222]MBB4628051.1 hypothetical protein [Paracoccus denitrificans]MCU7429120.1 hypothetical protein [Paracoccus denitrificans]QAR28429.1 hypothetical protein EO213_19195 [Paracoccus denitrificans]UPV96568.1 hypothetical protein M0K93_19285 [Paracoccus denitrificans]